MLKFRGFSYHAYLSVLNIRILRIDLFNFFNILHLPLSLQFLISLSFFSSQNILLHSALSYILFYFNLYFKMVGEP
jgi:hypothetical protein